MLKFADPILHPQQTMTLIQTDNNWRKLWAFQIKKKKKKADQGTTWTENIIKKMGPMLKILIKLC